MLSDPASLLSVQTFLSTCTNHLLESSCKLLQGLGTFCPIHFSASKMVLRIVYGESKRRFIKEFRPGTIGLQISRVLSLVSALLWGLPNFNLSIRRTMLHSAGWSLSSPGRKGIGAKPDLSFFRCRLLGIGSLVHTDLYAALPGSTYPAQCADGLWH